VRKQKKALFYCRINCDDRANAGVVKKCLGQVEGFRQIGWDVDMVWLCNKGILLNNELIHLFKYEIEPHNLNTYLFYFFRWHDILIMKLKLHEYNLIYARYELAHLKLVSFFRFIKSIRPKTTIILEVPTYPYAKELKGFIRKVQLLIDMLFRNQLKRYVSLVVSFGNVEEIFGIKTLPMRNRISIENIPFSTSENNSKNEVRLIAVGCWSFWHGLDRLIIGLAEHYEKKISDRKYEIKLDIIGSGKELGRLKKLVEIKGLDKVVKFTPPLLGEQLNQAFNDASIGIGSLGLHRLSLKKASPLKHREYCARGLPFILSTPDPDFTKNTNWVKYYPVSEEPINMADLIDFYESFQNDIKYEMRDFALNQLTWKSFFEKVVKHI